MEKTEVGKLEALLEELRKLSKEEFYAFKKEVMAILEDEGHQNGLATSRQSE